MRGGRAARFLSPTWQNSFTLHKSQYVIINHRGRRTCRLPGGWTLCTSHILRVFSLCYDLQDTTGISLNPRDIRDIYGASEGSLEEKLFDINDPVTFCSSTTHRLSVTFFTPLTVWDFTAPLETSVLFSDFISCLFFFSLPSAHHYLPVDQSKVPLSSQSNQPISWFWLLIQSDLFSREFN